MLIKDKECYSVRCRVKIRSITVIEVD